MSHRKAGVRGLQQQRRTREQFQKAGEEIAVQQLEQMKIALEALKNNLEIFAQKHSNEIKKDPVFRTQFQNMCAQVGVDPLVSNKSFWTEMLGFGDFYYQLSVQIAQVCIVTREQNGGLIEVGELIKQVEKMRGKNSLTISEYILLIGEMMYCRV
ncbi:Vacuolar protein sorting-associated protein SNF8 [Terramyces sp. JEL0728]|nr:Vacuolar protein sorting-associated protein SNF8 [Terramyces sp. JEL0728]